MLKPWSISTTLRNPFRIVDFLNMGYVDSVYFGKEIITEWDKEVKRLKEIYKN